MTTLTYTLRPRFGSYDAILVDEKVRGAVEDLTGCKTVTRAHAAALGRLGFSLEYHGDVPYEDDPIYPIGAHRQRPADLKAEVAFARSRGR